MIPRASAFLTASERADVGPTAEAARAATLVAAPAAGPRTGCLDWLTYAGSFSGAGDAHVRAVRPIFTKFAEEVGALIGGGASDDELHAASLVVFVHIAEFLRAGGADVESDGGPRVRRAAAALSSALHKSVGPLKMLELAALVKPLAQWRVRYGSKMPPIEISEPPAPVAASAGGPVVPLDVPRSAAASVAAFYFPFFAMADLDPQRTSDTRSSGGGGGGGGGGKDTGVTVVATGARATARIDAHWLAVRCATFTVATGSAFTPDALGAAIVEALQRHHSDSGALQGALFELLGESGFDLLAEIFEHRAAVAAVTLGDLRRAAIVVARGGGGDGGDRGGGGEVRRAPPPLGSCVTVVRESDIKAERAREKEARRERRRAGADDAFVGGGVGGGAVPGGGGARGVERAPDGRGIYTSGTTISADDAIAAVGASLAGIQQTLLPEGTTDIYVNGLREVRVPPPPPPGQWDTSRLISIASLPPFVQRAFSGMFHLNRLQSELFDAAYNGNENLLVCAPTGAGKTNIAMLTVCRELLAHLEPDGVTVRKDEFKIIYVAPMKALAQEVVAKFSERLGGLGLKVRELTGDMQLTRAEIAATQVIVTTPEKWDVITRKGGEGELVASVRLLIIDEVHLLADSRGAVIESIVARTLRLVETSQSVIRIVGLSATLPNYKDVGVFLRVNPTRGLFHFDGSYRPVPLKQTFIGISEPNVLKRLTRFNDVAWQRAIDAVRRGKQVMVFVHSRKDTSKTARALLALARADASALNLLSPFSDVEAEDTDNAVRNGGGRVAATGVQGEGRVSLSSSAWVALQREVDKSRNAELKELFPGGFGIHHAGMLRSDRILSEKLFSAGVIKVLCCTATLAWGVNLPAHTVIIKGTQVYDAEAGGFMDLSLLDVTQIFGRAGRPQFDSSGEGIIITDHASLPRYLSLLTNSIPIESSFIKALADHLNAEIVSGTVTNVVEAVAWLSYTYLYVRMLRNPLAYGITHEEKARDPLLDAKRLELVMDAARRLDECHMVRYDVRSGNLAVTDLGRVASHYYLVCETVSTFNRLLLVRGTITDVEALDMLCNAHEFSQVKVREEEMADLDSLRSSAPIKIKGDVANSVGKTNVLLQASISGFPLKSFTLISDTAYISQSAGRISRALFEIALKKRLCTLAERFLTISKAIDKKMWWSNMPLRQFSGSFGLPPEVVRRLEDSGAHWEDLLDSSPAELGALVLQPKLGQKLASSLAQIPRLDVDVRVQPLTRGIVQLTVTLWAGFQWSERIHGLSDPWIVWVEDAAHERIIDSESVLLTRRVAGSGAPTVLTFAIPVFEPLPTHYWLRVVSDRWLSCESVTEISFRDLVLPQRAASHTDLLELPPLPVTALRAPALEGLYRFSHFNPVQTQCFGVLYNTDRNVLLGAPTGSGKTVAAELAIFRLWAAHPGAVAIYIAPLKALVAERIRDWTAKFSPLGRRVVELTGDTAPDAGALRRADVIVTTPEKWDAVTRGWRTKPYIGRVGLVVIDEIHLLGEARGPVLEVIISRMRYIVDSRASTAASAGTAPPMPTRFVGLSTALANAADIADWLGIDGVGLYNFRPSVRPIPMDIHVQGFPGKHYCPRMQSMNKPIARTIALHAPDAPTLVFVSSRRQTRLTAFDLIAQCASEDAPRRFLRMSEGDATAAAARVRDEALANTLVFGIGLHHAGLCEADRALVESLFCARKILVLIATSTLAWGVNFPAHLVIVKGTEYFDANSMRYIDFPVTDVLQMMGRAGRPGFDTKGVAVILAAESKKNFYKKFLYEPFPVESHLLSVLSTHLCSEIAEGAVCSRHDAVEFITWTYFFRRLLQNPSWYGLSSADPADVRAYLYELVDGVIEELSGAGAITTGAQAIEILTVARANVTATTQSAAAVAERAAAAAAAADAVDIAAGRGPSSARRVVFDEAAARAAAVATVLASRLPLEEDAVAPTVVGAIASQYYLAPQTPRDFQAALVTLPASPSAQDILFVLCDAIEFKGTPVRHSEDALNAALGATLPAAWAPRRPVTWESPHTKTALLLAARLARAPLPIADYFTDTKSVLDNSKRVLCALVDVAADAGCWRAVRAAATLSQALALALLPEDSAYEQLPHVDARGAAALKKAAQKAAALAGGNGVDALADVDAQPLRALGRVQDGSFVSSLTTAGCSREQAVEALRAARALSVPKLTIRSINPARSGEAEALGGGEDRARALSVAAGAELSLRVDVTPTDAVGGGSRRGGAGGGGDTSGGRRGAKGGYWVAVGDGRVSFSGDALAPVANPELHTMRRVGAGGGVVELRFSVPAVRGLHALQVWALSDSVAGGDVGEEVWVNVC